jgi:hypothetical protein
MSATIKTADEREAFEAWVISYWRGRGFATTLTDAEMVKRDHRGNYESSLYEAAWEGWQARTSLAPVPPQEGEMPELPPSGLSGALKGLYTGADLLDYGRQCASLAAERVPEPAALPAEVTDEQIIALAEKHFRSYAHEAKTVFLEFAEDLLQLATPPAQPSESAPTDEAIEAAITNATGFEWKHGELQPMNAHDLINISTAILALATPIAAQPAAAEPSDEALREAAHLIYIATVGGLSARKTYSETMADIVCAIRSLAAPAQAAAVPEQTVGSALTDERIKELWIEHGLDECDPEGFARIIEREVLSRPTAAGEAEQ